MSTTTTSSAPGRFSPGRFSPGRFSPARVIADLRALADRTGGPEGSTPVTDIVLRKLSIVREKAPAE